MNSSIKEERSKLVENVIIDAALDTIEQYTISGTRMHLIAQQAEMLQSNLHYYYKTKDDLLRAVQKRVLEYCTELRNEKRQGREETLESQLDVFIEQKKQFILKENRYDYAEIDFWLQGRLNPEIKKDFAVSYNSWREDIQNTLRKYVPSMPENKVVLLSYQFVSLLEGATIQYLIDENSFSLDEYFDNSKKLILDAVKDYR